MIEPFKGELLLHPCALDYNGNVCSNSCAYCFAQARGRDAGHSLKSLVDLCYGRSRGNGLKRWLFDQGYAVNLSNRTDPLCTVNAKDTDCAFQALNAVSNGVMIQTKGRRHVDDAIRQLDAVTKKNVCLYVSITSRRDEILGRVEPGAANYDGRIALCDYAVRRNWAVIVGLNPLHQPWMSLDELEETICDCVKVGAKNFLVQALHLSSFLKMRMSQNAITRLDGFASNAADYFNSVRRILVRREKENSIHWMQTIFRAMPSHMFDDIRKTLGLTMRSTQDFVDFAIDSPRRFFTLDDWLAVMSQDNPGLLVYGARNLNGYLFTCNRGAWKKSARSKAAFTFRDVYAEFWENSAYWPSPRNVGAGARFVPVYASASSAAPLRKKDGSLILVKTEFDWKAWEKKTITISDLKRKEVNTHELEGIL